MEDAHSLAGFGVELCEVVAPGEVKGDGKAERFRGLNVFQWLTMEIEDYFRSLTSNFFLSWKMMS